MESLKIRDKYTVASGKDFQCAACGVCCSLYSLVDLHVTDIFRISEHLGMSPKAFFDRYCKVISTDEHTWTFCMDIRGGCPFQKDRKCSIYEVRPDMCAFYPNSHTCFELSQAQKKEFKGNPACMVYQQKDDLILVPDIERMVDSRIFFLVREMYMVNFTGEFKEEEAKAYHEKGLAQVSNARMREIVHRQVMNEIMKQVPVDEATKEPLLTADEVATIYKGIRKR